MRLNIIGNGFDLYHGLPSKYYYFGCYLASRHWAFYKEMCEMYDIRCVKPTDFYEIEIVVEDIFWGCFEEHLGDLDPSWIEYSLMDDLGLENDEPAELNPPEAANAEIIQNRFREWIDNTVNTARNFDMIRSRIAQKRCRFRPDDFFVNFNYTHTLESVYSIPEEKVIHIHGECRSWDELIVGHGNNDAIARAHGLIYEIEKDPHYYHYQSERNRKAEYECHLSTLENLKKDVPRLSAQLATMLQNQKLDVDTIRVWGLSCGPVDKPYIRKLKELYPDARWQFSFFGAGEKARRIAFAKELGLKNVRYFEFSNPNSEIICNEIIKENKLELFPYD